MPLIGTIFSSLVLARAGLPTGTDLLSAPGFAMVAGTQGAFHTAAFGVGMAVLVAITAFSVGARRKKARAILERETE